MKLLILTVGIATTLSWSTTTLAQAQTDFGKEEFESKCASCHGQDGKGGGPLSHAFITKPADLTVLMKNNGGVFPAQRVYEVIDGRKDIEAHGPRAMPVWGREYRANTPDIEGYYDLRSSVTQAKILALIDYLYRLQDVK